ncbi:hypothetical protein EDB89DRAFT_1951871 [Lactarius sanguifluus]|nr:hypothetical protein EDB89DRAFT_1951871 [Lactarius sanguifluus]
MWSKMWSDLDERTQAAGVCGNLFDFVLVPSCVLEISYFLDLSLSPFPTFPTCSASRPFRLPPTPFPSSPYSYSGLSTLVFLLPLFVLLTESVRVLIVLYTCAFELVQRRFTR